MKTFCGLVLFAVTLLGIVSALAEENHSGDRPRTVALIVQNHAAQGAQIPMLALSDALTARLSRKGLQVINPYNAVGETENRTPAGEALPKASALELARALGAQGAVTASVIEFLDSTLGTPPIAHQYSIRVAFNLADAKTGAAVCGETIKVKSPKYTVAQHTANRQEYLGELIYSAADTCAELLERKASDWRPTPTPRNVEPKPQEARPQGDVLELRRKAPSTPQDLLKPKSPRPTDEDFTMSDFDALFESLVKSMLANPRFKENYEAAQTEKEGLPVVIIGSVANKSDGSSAQAYSDILKAIPDSLRIELFNSTLFDVKDDEMSVSLAQRILASDKSPVEDGELMNSLKQHGSPDFVIVGDIRLFVDHGKRKTCRAHLALHSLKTGKVVWEGKKTAIK